MWVITSLEMDNENMALTFLAYCCMIRVVLFLTIKELAKAQ